MGRQSSQSGSGVSLTSVLLMPVFVRGHCRVPAQEWQNACFSLCQRLLGEQFPCPHYAIPWGRSQDVEAQEPSRVWRWELPDLIAGGAMFSFVDQPLPHTGLVHWLQVGSTTPLLRTRVQDSHDAGSTDPVETGGDFPSYGCHEDRKR